MRSNRIGSEAARPGRRGWWRAVLASAATVALAAGVTAPAVAKDAGGPAPAAAPAAGRQAHTVSLDGYSFLVDGKRTYLWSGEFHYFRLPSPDLWRDIFQKMKAAGFNSTSLYFDWGYHSPKPGVYDFSGVRDVDKLLDMAQEAGLYVIARPAPYINAEVDSGGLPGWMTTTAGHNRSDDPQFLKYADEWLTQIDRIIARHQLTNGTGSVIAYQVENEYYNGSAAGRSYMKHLEDKARADGITVPLTGNNNGTFNSGAGALDVDGPDSYPQGFDCSNPTKWNGVPDISYDHPAGKPLYSPEFQGGAFDPWGGPGYDKCAQLINDQFANVFYKQNIAVGATAQSFYMTYGGTNWGWLGMPENYTSYDYGAAIRENRQLDPKYYEDKLIGYFTQSVAPLTKTDAIRATPPDDSAVVDTARMNPDSRTQFHVLRHGNSTSTAVDKTHISLDFNAQPAADTTYTWDDPDSALQYTGSWSHVANQSYTGGDYQHTESFSNKAGDSVTIPFDGTAIRWIGSKTNNHGYADVYLDGTRVATVDDSGGENQAVVFQKTGLTAGSHTLKIVVDGSHGSGSTDNYVAIDAIDVPTGTAASEPTYPVVPQQPGTAITLDGRDSHVVVANYRLGDAQLQYSTSEIMTNAAIGNRDVAVLYGDSGSDGETVLRYSSKPTVTIDGGTATTTWDAATGDLRLNYTHKGLIRVSVSGGGKRPLLLLVGDKDTAKTFWRQDTATGPVLVRGTHLLRTATSRDGGRTLALTGDNADDRNIEVFTSAAHVTWNGRALHTRVTGTGSLTGQIPVAAPVHLPALTNWKHAEESPEAAPAFDDSSWQVADRTTTNSVSGVNSLPVLYADDYGFHTGNTWYRGRFRATGKETGIHLVSDSGGKAQAFSAWLNGTFLGSSTTGSADFTFPAGSVKQKGDNVISVLTVNMGHEEDYNSTNGNKTARGLTSASLVGAPLTTVTWRLQGVRGGEDLKDTVRGPLSTGGLYGERAGWSLPGYPDGTWKRVTLPTTDTRPGVSWYRTDVNLDLPRGQDTSLGLTFSDDPSRKYRATIFVNGWQVGNYVNYLGPQHTFPVPNGILNPNGRNSIAIAVWNLDGSTGGLGKVSLTDYGSYASSLRVAQNDSPRYDPRTYAMPKRPGTEVALDVPDTAQSGQAFTAQATVRVPKDRSSASRLTASLSAPDGWSVIAVGPTSVERLRPGGSAVFTWKVQPPAGQLPSASALTATVHYRQDGRQASNADERIVGGVPPAPPAGKNAVSDLPFLSSTNGWGPVERDSSVGEQAAGDGRPISIAGVGYPKGLGTNSVSDVELYLAGKCSRFTADVGVDDETGGGGTVTFSVIADGKALVTTPTIKGKQSAVPIDVDVTGAQVVDLVVGDGGDGNGADHGDWAVPTLTCA
ncbi:beta-galactosidase [Streptomyces sp. Li-HN-5-11]|uniref:beta-galactosidase n=1 Tax=Streptomyces sp. Li-HN-5-11 TaxID=3075432 RepID=UPI0028AD3411|nr:beta-galactosidase [Streptomyces sp. Li-HN-5-11]WNM29898.1 beta-galactosidase [Streptomyces sp. Li-HN-5-11]